MNNKITKMNKKIQAAAKAKSSYFEYGINGNHEEFLDLKDNNTIKTINLINLLEIKKFYRDYLIDIGSRYYVSSSGKIYKKYKKEKADQKPITKWLSHSHKAILVQPVFVNDPKYHDKWYSTVVKNDLGEEEDI